MFERYTEKARRAIFFARFESSQFGSPYIETEHLLLGLLRGDKALANRFLQSTGAVESIRRQIEAHSNIRERVSTSVDLPLSHACKRVLAYGAEEAERFSHKNIDTTHLLFGLLREENSFAAQLLREQGLTLDSVRAEGPQSEISLAQRASDLTAAVERWLAERETRDDLWTASREHVANGTTRFAIYAVAASTKNEKGNGSDSAEEQARIQQRLDSILRALENAIAHHEFDKARHYSDEERKEREQLRLLREKFNLEEVLSRVPLLLVEIIRDDRFSDVQKRCDNYLAEGVPAIWLLDPNSKRAYTATQTEGLREFKGETLRIANPPLEMELKNMFV